MYSAHFWHGLLCLSLLSARAHRHPSRVGDDLGEVREVLVVEVRGKLEVVGGGEGGVGGRKVLHGAAVAAPVDVIASVHGRAKPVEGHTHLLGLGLLKHGEGGTG